MDSSWREIYMLSISMQRSKAQQAIFPVIIQCLLETMMKQKILHHVESTTDLHKIFENEFSKFTKIKEIGKLQLSTTASNTNRVSLFSKQRYKIQGTRWSSRTICKVRRGTSSSCIVENKGSRFIFRIIWRDPGADGAKEKKG